MSIFRPIRNRARHLRRSIEIWKLLSSELGWSRTSIQGRAVDPTGRAIPWYTYPAIEYLRTLDMSECRVFEYGCGNSTIFFADRVKEIYSVENDPIWFDKLSAISLPNLHLSLALETSSYINAPITAGGKFDIVIIDGRHRVACAEIAPKFTKGDGLIVFDNADWYPDACAILRQDGWIQIDFTGAGPINSYFWTTALFLRGSLRIPRDEESAPVGVHLAGKILRKKGRHASPRTGLSRI